MTILLTCTLEIYKEHWFCFIASLVLNMSLGSKCHLLTSPKAPVDIHISNTEVLNEDWSNS